MIERVGYMLAAAAAEAIRTRQPLGRRPRGRRQGSGGSGADEDPAGGTTRCRRVLDDLQGQTLRGQVDGLPEAFFADLRLQMHAVQDEPDRVEVMALRVGDAAIVGLAGRGILRTRSGLETAVARRAYFGAGAVQRCHRLSAHARVVRPRRLRSHRGQHVVRTRRGRATGRRGGGTVAAAVFGV